MTTRIKTVTDHLLEAQVILDGYVSNEWDEVMNEEEKKYQEVSVPKDRLQSVANSIMRALDAIQLVRSETQAALDKF